VGAYLAVMFGWMVDPRNPDMTGIGKVEQFGQW
jgi:hypothetical protein